MRRLKSWHSWWQEAVSLILLFVTLEVAVRSIEQAQWINPQPSMTLTLFLAILAGILLTKNRLPGAVRYTIVIIVSALVIIWQSAGVLASREQNIADSLQSWWQAVSAVTPSESTIYFAIFITAIIWVTGYISVWYLLRRRNVWVALFLGAVIALVNLSNLPEREYKFFFFYLITAALLLGHWNWAKHSHWFKKGSSTQIRRGVLYFVASFLVLTIFATSVAWYTPQIRLKSLETLVSSHLPQTKDISQYRANIFAAVPRKQPYLKSDEQDTLSFGKSFDIGEEVQFTITTTQPLYWRVRAYDVYNSLNWVNSPATEKVVKQGSRSPEADNLTSKNEITYTVVPQLKTDILLIAGEFISSNTMEVSRIQVGGEDTVSIITRRILRPYESYTVTSGTRSPSPGELSRAGDSYPQWMTGYYLQLPSTLPERVKQLSLKITEKMKSPYEKALAINSYLSHFTYNQEIKAPPKGVDAVDHFLFTLQSGNCEYFASAMVVMLRYAGVPARLVTGYLPGEEDKTNGSSVIKAKQFHAWPEVYFPGHGWIEVEKMPVPVAVGTGEDGDISGFVGYVAEPWDIGEGIPSSYSGSEMKPDYIVFPVWFYPAVLSIIAIGLIFILVIWILRAVFDRWLWGRKGAGTISEIYARICYLASLTGMKPQPYQTPLEYCDSLINAFPYQAKALNYIVRIYLESQFGGRKNPDLDNDVLLLKSRTDIYHFLMSEAGHIKYLLRKR